MSGKILSIVLLASGLIAGVAMYYLQVFHFYREVPADAAGPFELTLKGSDGTQAIDVTDVQAIDADSSPIRFRACFDTSLTLDDAAARFERYDGAAPLVAPFWFDCFDADAIGAAIAAGDAAVFTGQRNLEYGIDRVVAITRDGRGYVWHEVNDCGDKAYDGSPLGEDCPPRDGD